MEKETKSFVYGIVVTAYMIMAYDVFQEFGKNPVDYNLIAVKMLSAIGSLGVGILVFWYIGLRKK